MISRLVCSPSFYEWLTTKVERGSPGFGQALVGIPVQVDEELLEGLAQVYDHEGEPWKHLVLEGDDLFVLDVGGVGL